MKDSPDNSDAGKTLKKGKRSREELLQLHNKDVEFGPDIEPRERRAKFGPTYNAGTFVVAEDVNGEISVRIVQKDETGEQFNSILLLPAAIERIEMPRPGSDLYFLPYI